MRGRGFARSFALALLLAGCGPAQFVVPVSRPPLPTGDAPERTRFQPSSHIRPPFRFVWGRNLRTLVEFPAVVYNGAAYVSTYSGRLWALSMEDGRVLWRRDLESRQQASSPAVVGQL